MYGLQSGYYFKDWDQTAMCERGPVIIIVVYR